MASLESNVEEESALPVALSTDREAQTSVTTEPQNMTIDDITCTLESKVQITDININVRGCSVFDNKTTIFASSGSRSVILFNENGENVKVIHTSSGPWDVTIIDDNTLAVSTTDGVQVFNINANSPQEPMDIGRCYGLDYYKGSLFCCVSTEGVLAVNLASNTSDAVVPIPAKSGWYYCTVYNDKIYTTQSAFNTVTCYTMGGDKVWAYNDPSVIKFPVGIAVDNKSNIFVASYCNNSIVVLSSDGQRHRTLLTQKDGISAPWALRYNRSNNQLLVGNEGGTGLLFNIRSAIAAE